MTRGITVRLCENGQMLVDGWPEETEISQAFLDSNNSRYVQVDGDRVHLTADNGAATYVLIELNPTRMTWRAARLYGRINE